MSDIEIGEQFQVILVGKSGDQFIRYALEVLNDYDIFTVRSEDIYSAAVQLGKGESGKQVVIGRYERLNREDGRFFEKLSEKTVPCCCLVRGPEPDGRIFKRTKGKGVYLIFHQEQLTDFIESVAGRKEASRQSNKSDREEKSFREEEFRTSEAELEALFGSID